MDEKNPSSTAILSHKVKSGYTKDYEQWSMPDPVLSSVMTNELIFSMSYPFATFIPKKNIIKTEENKINLRFNYL